MRKQGGALPVRQLGSSALCVPAAREKGASPLRREKRPGRKNAKKHQMFSV